MKKNRKTYLSLFDFFRRGRTRGRICLLKKGFSLVETLISVFLFSLIVLMISGAFTAFLKNYNDARKAEKSLEGAQFAMNLMAKTIRSSDVVSLDGGSSLGCYDYAQSKCIKYSIVDDSASGLKKVQVSEKSPANNLNDCGGFSGMSSAQDITSGDISNAYSAYFNVTPSTTTTRGIVSLAFSSKEVGQTSSPLVIQMTVSLRNLKP